ncbi:MAG TPA: carboxypeptidase-like regulatory domain-containing protein, partial [Flavisolibacter sp.]
MKEKCRRTAFTMYLGSLKLLKVKLTGAIMLFTCLQVWAHTYSQDRITLKLQDADLKKTFQAIEQQSKYRFLYNEALIANKSTVDIDVQEADISTVLNRIFSRKGIDYELLQNNLIVLKSGSGKGARYTAQAIPITGNVRGANGEPLPGVSVSLRGSQQGTTTDASGNFSINVPDAAAVLVFSYVGYGTQEITVGTQTTITVTMSTSSTTNLNEVIVVGYGTQRRREVTGSVASVRGAELAKQPVLTATQAVQGKVAGVQVISSGDPNALPTIRIRGTGTMLGGANPLYVVDGIINDDIRNINSADIVSM